MHVRRATVADAAAVGGLYNEGVRTREATFETRERTVEEVAERLGRARPEHASVLGEVGGEVVGAAWLGPYSDRTCYAGVADFSVYVSGAAQGYGVGSVLLAALLELAEQAGLHKVTSRVLAENTASRRLCTRLGFREVGVHRRHARLEGRWRDVVTVEILLGAARE